MKSLEHKLLIKDEPEKIADEIKEKLGIFKNQEMSRFSDDEYPKTQT